MSMTQHVVNACYEEIAHKAPKSAELLRDPYFVVPLAGEVARIIKKRMTINTDAR